MSTLFASVPMSMFLGPLGPQELIVILLIAVLVFGGKKIPEIGKGLGEGIRGFKDAIKSGTKSEEKEEKPASTSTH